MSPDAYAMNKTTEICKVKPAISRKDIRITYGLFLMQIIFKMMMMMMMMMIIIIIIIIIIIRRRRRRRRRRKQPYWALHTYFGKY